MDRIDLVSNVYAECTETTKEMVINVCLYLEQRTWTDVVCGRFHQYQLSDDFAFS